MSRVAPKRMAAFTVGRPEVRLAMRTTGGDLRAVGAMLGLSSEQILMILAYDVLDTRVAEKTGEAIAALESMADEPSKA
jgi:hypothetical protein